MMNSHFMRARLEHGNVSAGKVWRKTFINFESSIPKMLNFNFGWDLHREWILEILTLRLLRILNQTHQLCPKDLWRPKVLGQQCNEISELDFCCYNCLILHSFRNLCGGFHKLLSNHMSKPEEIPPQCICLKCNSTRRLKQSLRTIGGNTESSYKKPNACSKNH